jgi:hypothetical protein
MLTLIALSTVLMQEPAAPPPPPPLDVHSRVVFMGGTADGPGGLDADGDGQVTRDEFAAPLNTAFGRMDKDGDGRLSSEELTADRGPGDSGVTIHRRGGGDVEHVELRRSRPAGARGARFERDGERTMVFVGPEGRRDEDARVVVRTLSEDGPAVLHLRQGPDGVGDARVLVRTIGGPGHGPDDLDKDDDGKVSEAEFIAPLREAFARADIDRSGFIDDSEHGDDNQVHVFTRRLETRDDE